MDVQQAIDRVRAYCASELTESQLKGLILTLAADDELMSYFEEEIKDRQARLEEIKKTGVS